MATSQVLEYCDPILHAVRSSKLNFTIQETPYSFYLTIRKSFARHLTSEVKSSSELVQDLLSCVPRSSDLDRLHLENETLRTQCQFLENEKSSLTSNLEEEILNNLSSKTRLELSENRLNNVQDKFESLETKYQKLKTEKELLEKRHEKNCAEFRISKSESEDLSKELNSLSVALKSAKKQLKDETFKHEKIVSKHVAKIQDLEEFRLEKCSEEKEFKKKQKKLNQKLKKVHESEAKLKLSKLEVKPKLTLIDENRNEPDPEEENDLTPLIPVSNLYDIFSEAD